MASRSTRLNPGPSGLNGRECVRGEGYIDEQRERISRRGDPRMLVVVDTSVYVDDTDWAADLEKSGWSDVR